MPLLSIWFYHIRNNIIIYHTWNIRNMKLAIFSVAFLAPPGSFHQLYMCIYVCHQQLIYGRRALKISTGSTD